MQELLGKLTLTLRKPLITRFRLHEVVTRAATLQSGLGVAGLGPIAQPGVEDIDLSAVVEGHMELQTKMGDVMRVINVDA